MKGRVGKLREAIDERIKRGGRWPNRTAALRAVDMSHTTLERLLRVGLCDNPRELTRRKLAELGILDLIPRQ